MAAFFVSISTWLHALATIIMVGYFFFAGFIYLPALERHMKADDLREMLEQVSARLRPFFGGSLLVFLVTGTYLMLKNESYLGLGNFFSNPWSVLIVVKHVLLLPFLALAVYPERVFLGQISDQKPKALKQFNQTLRINTVLGLVIILLTSLAQSV